jgi:hypothetical protein
MNFKSVAQNHKIGARTVAAVNSVWPGDVDVPSQPAREIGPPREALRRAGSPRVDLRKVACEKTLSSEKFLCTAMGYLTEGNVVFFAKAPARATTRIEELNCKLHCAGCSLGRILSIMFSTSLRIPYATAKSARPAGKRATYVSCFSGHGTRRIRGI